MGWIRFDGDRIKRSSWLMKIGAAERFAWLAFVHYSSPRPRGQVDKMELWLLAENLHCPLDVVERMMSAGIGKGAIQDCETYWLVTNYDEYNPPREEDKGDIAKRVKRHREAKKRNVTHGNAGNAPTSTSTYTSTKLVSPDGDTEHLDFADEFVLWWNNDLKSEIPEMRSVKVFSQDRRKVLLNRLKEPNFNRESLLSALRNAKFARENPKTFDFDFVIGMPSRGSKRERPENYIKLLEGKYDNSKPKQDFSAYEALVQRD